MVTASAGPSAWLAPILWLHRAVAAGLLALGSAAFGAEGLGNGLLEVDPDSGAASLYLPLGPGIGGPGARYRPALIGRFAPQVELEPIALRLPTGFELSPGSLEWVPGPEGSDSARWVGPDGSGGATCGAARTEPRAGSVWTRFGYPPATHLANPSARMWPAVGGDELLAWSEGDGPPAPGAAPSHLLVVRGPVAYEFQPLASECSGRPQLPAAFRLTAIRAESGAPVSFRYGGNGIDFEAVGADTRLRVTLEGAAPADPVPALDAPVSTFEATARPSFRTVTARLRVAYVGAGELPGFTILAQVAELAACTRANLQVVAVQADDPAETIRFGYGPGWFLSRAGAGELVPTMLQTIQGPGLTLELAWQALPGSRPGGDPDRPPVGSFGVAAIWDREVRTLHWGGIRQFRHVALEAEPQCAPACHTYVRDRWPLSWSDENSRGPGYDYDQDIPTFELDPATLTLRPVLGRVTRWCNGTPGGMQSPDLHFPSGIRPGLRGGANPPPIPPGSAGPPPITRAGPVWCAPIRYDPSRPEATIARAQAGVQSVQALHRAAGMARAEETSRGIPAGFRVILIPNAARLVGQAVCGDGNCVALAKAFGAPQTALWAPGPAPDRDTPLGTLVATFFANLGKTFANQSGFSHVGALLGVDDAGITLLDQYRNPPVATIQSSYYIYGGARNYNADARNYHIILVASQ